MKTPSIVKTLCLNLLYLVTISACVSIKTSNCVDCSMQSTNNYICNNAGQYQGRVIGDGHCVSLIKHCSGAPNTVEWRAGELAWKNRIAPGTIIATFKNGRYPNITGYHAAIYIEQDSRGIWVWDQWLGKPVHKRLIRWRNNGATDGNTAQAYRTVLRNITK